MNKKINRLDQAKKVEKKVHLLINAIDADPKNIENYLQLSAILIDMGSVDQEVELLERAKSSVDDPQKLNYNLAIGYYLQGKFDKSLSLLNKMPNDDSTLYQKALVFLKLGQAQKALAYALSIKKIDNHVNELIGDCWLALDDLKRAYSNFNRISEKDRSAKVNFLLGITIFGIDRDKAESYFIKAKKQDAKYYSYAKKQYNGILNLLQNSKN